MLTNHRARTLVGLSLIIMMVWPFQTQADMDAPRWYEFLSTSVTIENLGDDPKLTFFTYFGPEDIGGPYYEKLTPDHTVFGERVYWTENENYSEAGVPEKNPKFRALPPFVSFLDRYYGSLKTLSTIADPIQSIQEVFHLAKNGRGDFLLESRSLVFGFKDGKKVAIAASSIDEKSPFFWLKPAHDFKFSETKKFSNHEFALIEASVYNSMSQNVWDGSKVEALTEGKNYSPKSKAVFYLVYAVPKDFWTKVAERERAVEISERNKGQYLYLGGFFASTDSTRPLVEIDVEGLSGSPRRLASSDLNFFYPETPKVATEVVESAPPPLKLDSVSNPSGTRLPSNPDTKLYFGIPLAAGLALGLGLWWRARKKKAS